MMKWLLLLFTAYMLVLPCIPCNAAEVCCAEEDVCLAEAPEGHTDQEACTGEEYSCPEELPDEHEHSATCPEELPDEHEHSATCPEELPDEHKHSATCPCCPSFSCNTCHSLIVSALVLAEPIIPARSFENIHFTDKPLANFSAIIWQPPKTLS